MGIKADNEYPFVSKMKKSSPFSETDLRIGMRVLSINVVDLKGKPLKECTGIIKDAPAKVDILASVEEVEKEGLIIHDDFSRMNLPRWYIPSYLVTAGVTEEEWSKIYDMIHVYLFPVLRNTIGCENILSHVLGGYVGSQMVGGVVGFGVESRGEKNALTTLKDAADSTDHLTHVATNLLAVANAMLNRRGVAVELALWTKAQEKFFVKSRPNGFKFVVL